MEEVKEKCVILFWQKCNTVMSLDVSNRLEREWLYWTLHIETVQFVYSCIMTKQFKLYFRQVENISENF